MRKGYDAQAEISDASHGAAGARTPNATRSLGGFALVAMTALSVGAFGCDYVPPDDAPELDLETKEAEGLFGTFMAERAEHSFVGPLDEGQAIGITFFDEAGTVPLDEAAPGDEVAVRLYDGEAFAALLGELEECGKTALKSEPESDFEAEVELVLGDKAVKGAATFADEKPLKFKAKAATGVGGVYFAQGTQYYPDVSADWLVLDDDRQWGCVCGPPGTSACCHLRQ